MQKQYNIEQLMDRSGVKFGTSGARGLADNMTDEVCYVYTLAFLQYLEQNEALTPGAWVAIAGDLRPSTPRICAAVARAVTDKGYGVRYCGEIPSPAVAYYGFSHAMPSVMVTGSHIPDDRNGIKYNTPVGEVLKQDERGIRAQSVSVGSEIFDTAGSLVEAFPLPAITTEAEHRYIQRYTDFFGDQLLRGMKLGFYEHSCVGRDTLQTIYKALGAKVTGLGRSATFIPVDTEAIRPEDSALALAWAADGSYDALVSADGDCDRPLIADETGQWLRGDVAGILCAQYLGADTVATPVSCNSAVELCASFTSVRRTRIGSPFVIAEMQAAAALGGAGMVVGYEANGGFLTYSDLECDGRTLGALPTRDATLVHIALLALSQRRGISMAELVGTLPGRYTASNRLTEFPTERSNAQLAHFSTHDFDSSAHQLTEIFGALCGTVKAIDTTDGVRVTFDNLEIIHLRPSGNAPELRVYNEAASPARALELNQACLDIMASWR